MLEFTVQNTYISVVVGCIFMEKNNIPGLFGIANSNRDYTRADTWGKNQFNSSFPVALACYLFHKNLK